MTRARRPLRPVLLLATIAMIAAGCGGGGGGGDGDAYEAGLARVQDRLAEATEASQGAVGVADAQERGAALSEAYESIEAAATAAAELEPPEDVEDAHAQLVDALRDYAELYARLANTPENDPSLTELYGEAGEIVERLDAANREIDEAGYTVPTDADDGDE